MEGLNKKNVDQLENELQELKKDLAEIAHSVHSILTLLKGNDLDTANGMVEKLHACDMRLARVEDFITKIKWVAIGATIPAGVGILEILKVIFGGL